MPDAVGKPNVAPKRTVVRAWAAVCGIAGRSSVPFPDPSVEMPSVGAGIRAVIARTGGPGPTVAGPIAGYSSAV